MSWTRSSRIHQHLSEWLKDVLEYQNL
nr:unnamed protein product [Callosobruchus analis]